jgi:hypothetical protein
VLLAWAAARARRLLRLVARPQQQAVAVGAAASGQLGLTPGVGATQAAGEPRVKVTRHGGTVRVDASVAVASPHGALWAIVRSCLNGGSPGVLRDVRRAEVLERRNAEEVVLYQEVGWRCGRLLHGTNRLRTLVRTVCRHTSALQLHAAA